MSVPLLRLPRRLWSLSVFKLLFKELKALPYDCFQRLMVLVSPLRHVCQGPRLVTGSWLLASSKKFSIVSRNIVSSESKVKPQHTGQSWRAITLVHRHTRAKRWPGFDNSGSRLLCTHVCLSSSGTKQCPGISNLTGGPPWRGAAARTQGA